ncbi:MAG: NTP transferase domain-containing protein [Elusimicrobia bacterium]|nr:NTP transferase domain-containing protein [Elusimicrobiota bacterium]
MATLRVEALIQARTSSRRLPGKVLRPLAGRPLIFRVVDRARRAAGIDGAVVVTSTDPTDDALAAVCAENGVPLERGDLRHVARRLAEAAARRGLDAFVRVNGDSPFLDPLLIAEAVRVFRDGAWDVVTNVFPRSYPPGQSVEVVRSSALEKAVGQMTDPEDAEHVTRFFYAHPGGFRLRNLTCPDPAPGISLCVDTPEDWPRAEWIAARLDAGGGWREAVALARSWKAAVA